MTATAAVLAATFGRGSTQPLRAVYWRLSTLALLTGCVSIAIYSSIASLPLTPLSETASLPLAGMGAMQLLVLASLLASYGISSPGGTDVLLRLFASLPLPKAALWRLAFMPQFICAGFALLAGGLPLSVLLLRLGIQPGALVLSGLFGVWSAFGLLYGTIRGRAVLSLSLLPLLLYGEYRLAGILASPGATASDKTVAACTLLIGCSVLILRFTHSGTLLHRLATSPKRVRHIGLVLPSSALWHLVQVLRHSTTRLSLFTTLGLSVGMAATAVRFEQMGIVIPLSLVGLLIASCASDFRGITRRRNPAEIAQLTGSYRFVLCQVASMALASVAVVGPLLWAAHGQGHGIAELVIFSISGVTTGLFASTLIIPMRGNITSQIVATLLCLALLVGLPSYSSFWSAHATAAMLGVAAIALIASLGIEYKRNPFFWSNHAQ
ncbi:MAG TPA: hypothetical protein VD735_05340 [Candidatus Saccharimonadales bacterium]|nr:hypothetical protein [Candidatus Saccharimonadales bacterium]